MHVLSVVTGYGFYSGATFTHEDIDYLKRKGLPGGNPCHSPMAYLATAMTDILVIVKTEEALENFRKCSR
ncbi:MAG: hypothetical protein AABZ06_06470 [Bdellovibrionota bacterium]